jgi:hypothetical protein
MSQSASGLVRLGAGLLAAPLLLGPLTPTNAAADDGSPPAYLRVEDDPERVALQVATRQFVPAEGDGPTVALVAVAHIGEQAFYRQLASLLETYDVVLYESVMPPGARGAAGEHDAERAENTAAVLRFTASLLESYRERHGAYPQSLQTLSQFVARRDARLAHGLASARAAADMVVTAGDGVPAAAGDSGQLQAELAAALGLSFQLDAIDYEQEGWRCSDMEIDDLERALRTRGIEMDLTGQTLAGTNLPMQVIKFMLRLVRMADVFLHGAIADTFKVLLIEMLGDESMMEMSLEQMGPGFAEVIVDMRNQVAVDDLRQVVQGEPQIRSVAIFYGAAHMQDLQQRLQEQLDYRSATGEPAVRWFDAIEVDLTRSTVSAADLQQMRGMVKRMMRR